MSIAHIGTRENERESRDGVRSLPHDMLAEQSALGGMLLSKDAVADCVEQVKGIDFYAPKHELIYDSIMSLYSRGEPTDAISVSDDLHKNGLLARAGGPDYLHSLTDMVPTAANAGYYASIVAEKAVLRRMVEAGTRIAQLGYDAQGEVVDLVNRAQSEVYQLTGGMQADDYIGLSEAIGTALDEMEAAAGRDGELIGTPTNFRELDDLTHGLHPGQLIIVAARPAMGKSTLALDFARAAAIGHNKAAIFFSLEMGRSEIAMRMISAEAQLPLQKMRKGTIEPEDWTTIAKVRSRISEAPLFIDDAPNLTLMEIRSKCRRLAQTQEGLGLVVIDYLQLLTSGRKVENRQQEVSEFSRALKLMAKELNVPVIALAQLNRGPEQRADKMPMLSDLRESGSLEQDADIVILLHREAAYERDHPRQGEADLIVAKHRNGPTRTVTVAFQGHFSRFADMPAL